MPLSSYGGTLPGLPIAGPDGPAILDALAEGGRAIVSGRSWSRGGPASGSHVYANTGIGDPIDYATPIATLSVPPTSFTVPGTLAPGEWLFGVRAFDSYGEEQNLDCAVRIAIDAGGDDVTDRPLPPYGLTARPTAAAGVRAEWWYPLTAGPTAPTGFYVYITAGDTVSYVSYAATVSYASGVSNGFVANLPGLTSGTSYSVGVRAYNACGAERNTAAVSVTADSAGPAAVDALVGTAIV